MEAYKTSASVTVTVSHPLHRCSPIHPRVTPANAHQHLPRTLAPTTDSISVFHTSEEPPSLPKKIRSCCLYKYPDWVQGMVGEGRAPVSGQPLPPSSHSQIPGGFGPSTTTTSGRPPFLARYVIYYYRFTSVVKYNFNNLWFASTRIITALGLMM
uniref:Uncharacterized protein n=1 Tax=Heterorhabditis bacteriophora TaxID=37862 RepID=A0A1I7X3K0_HETBA